MEQNNNIDAFKEAREKMILTQLVATGVQRQSLLDAVYNLLREDFTPPEFKTIAYSAQEIRLPNERFLLSPMDIGLMFDRIDFDNAQKGLIIADSSGYATAILSELVEDITALDQTPEFTNNIQNIVSKYELKNVTIVENNVLAGCADHGPYDFIFINGSVQQIPDCFYDQLAPEGKIYCFQNKQFISHAVAQFKSPEDGSVQTERLFEASVTLLPEFKKASKFVF